MLEIRTFGGLSVLKDGAPCGGAAAQRKTLALLALLAVAGDKGMSRDKLVAYLWPDSDDAHARNLLSQACYALRRDLGASELFLGSTELRLNPALMTSDIQTFEDALRRGDPGRAVQVYTGSFLDGFFVSEAGEFERWVDGQRERLMEAYAGALKTLANTAAERGDHGVAAEWWRRLVEAHPLNADAALGLMTALDAAGEHAEALRAGQTHAAYVHHELGTEPAAAVSSMIRRLKQQPGDGQPGGPISSSVPTTLLRRVHRAHVLSLVALGAVAILFVLAASGVWRRPPAATEVDPIAPAGRKMLAVLPLENQGAAADEYFADGLSEAIAARLGSVRTLGVIAWQSARQYKGTTKTPQQIGRELGAQYLLEGTVRWEKPGRGPSQVRVSPTLIRVSDGAQLWASQYDTVLAGVFAVQADLATSVVSALDIALGDAERQVLEARPTANLQAYDAYLRGRALIDKDWGPADLRTAGQLLERAVTLDSTFAVAWAWSSWTHVALYWNYVDRDPKQLALCKAEAERALRLAPDLAESHAALGWYYYAGLRDYDRALQELTRARRERPSDAYITVSVGALKGHQGKWNEALAYGHEAALLNPRVFAGPANIYTWLREFAAANYYYDRTLALAPRGISARLGKAMAYLNLTGDLKGTQRLFPDVSENIVPTGLEDILITLSDIVLLLSDEQQSKLLRLSPAALDADTAALALAKALVYRRRGQSSLAAASFDSARTVLERAVRRKGDDHLYHALFGLALAGLGRDSDAVREGKRAIELLPVSKSAVDGALLPANLARIFVLLGDGEKALDQLDTVFARPGPLSANWLKVDPFWDSLRGSLRFQRLAGVRN